MGVPSVNLPVRTQTHAHARTHAQSAKCDCGEPEAMSHLLHCRLLWDVAGSRRRKVGHKIGGRWLDDPKPGGRRAVETLVTPITTGQMHVSVNGNTSCERHKIACRNKDFLTPNDLS